MLAAAVHVPDLGTLAGRHLDLLDAAEGTRSRPHGGVEEGLAGHGVSDAEGTRRHRAPGLREARRWPQPLPANRPRRSRRNVR